MAAQPQFTEAAHEAPLILTADALEVVLVESLDAAGCTLARHDRVVALALADFGSIDLPGAAVPDSASLQPLAPLYLVHELDQAGLLRAAEQVAGLFAGGAVTQDLGPIGARLIEFWQGRRQRLSEGEREQLLEQTFEPQYFYPLLRELCTALVAISDNAGVADLREEVGLEQAAAALGEFLVQRAVGMAAFAARDLLSTLTAALAFLRERTLQTAFGVRDLWSLVGLTAGGTSRVTQQIRSRVDLARSGAEVLTWLAASKGNYRPDTLAPQTQVLAVAAQRWLLAYQALDSRPLQG